MKKFFMKKHFIKKQLIIYSLLLLVFVCQIGAFPISVKALESESQIEEEQEYLDFTLSIGQEMSTDFLMGEVILPYVPDENKELKADVYFSTDGEIFTLLDRYFHEWSKLGKKTKRTCMYPTLSPLKEYLSGEIKSLFVYLEVMHPDGTIQRTKTAEMSHSDEVLSPDSTGRDPEEDGIVVQACFPATLRKRVRPNNYYGEYHVTVTESAVVSDYEDYLPDTIPIELQFYQKSSDIYKAEGVEYGVIWDTENPSLILEGEYAGAYQYEALELILPEEDFIFTFNQKKYNLSAEKYPQILLQPESIFSNLYCIMHPVEMGHQTELKLSLSDDADKSLCATLPLKPTDAMSILILTSVNDGADKTQGEIDLAQYPVNFIPNQPEYTIKVLSKAKTDALLEEGNGSFQIKLMISGGPLGNAMGRFSKYTFSLPAVWTGESDYQPPKDPTLGNGGEGNQGNTGTDNSGSTGGIRPGVDSTPEPDTEPKEEIPVIPSEPDTEPKEEIPVIPSEPDMEPEEYIPTIPSKPDMEIKEDIPTVSSKPDTESKNDLSVTLQDKDTENDVSVTLPEENTESKESEAVNLQQDNEGSTEQPLDTEKHPLKKEVAAVSVISVVVAGAVAAKSGLLAKLIAALSKWLHP